MLGTPPASLSTLPLRPAPVPEFIAEADIASPWLWLALAALGLGFVILYWLRHTRKPADPHAELAAAYRRLGTLADASAQVLAGEQLLRKALARRLGPKVFSQTATELAAPLSELAPATAVESALALLAVADQVKFGRATPKPEEARRLMEELARWLSCDQHPTA